MIRRAIKAVLRRFKRLVSGSPAARPASAPPKPRPAPAPERDHDHDHTHEHGHTHTHAHEHGHERAPEPAPKPAPPVDPVLVSVTAAWAAHQPAFQAGGGDLALDSVRAGVVTLRASGAVGASASSRSAAREAAYERLSQVPGVSAVVVEAA